MQNIIKKVVCPVITFIGTQRRNIKGFKVSEVKVK
jgi:hypothetical protein